jgi:uncharacterized protein (TIGR03437 family)
VNVNAASALVLWTIGTTGVLALPAQKELIRKLPLRFEETSEGDLQRQTRYIARGSNFELRAALSQNWLEWRDAAQNMTARVHTRLVGTNSKARMQAEDRLPGSANYFIGAPQTWRTEVPGFGRIRSRDVYPGIDFVFHGEQGRLEYDFVLAPHADPRRIRLELDGQRELRLSSDGDLIVSTGSGEVRWKRPDIYQEAEGTRRPVSGRFVLRGRRTIGFEIGAYDDTLPLVIDPVLLYSTYLGTGGNDVARGIARDALGNVYIAGTTSSTDLPTVSATQPNYGGRTTSLISGDAFVAKFSPTGSLLYLTYLGGSQDDFGAAIAVDSAGNAYITGSTTSPDFPLVSPYQQRYGGSGIGLVRLGDVFLAKLNPTGNKLIFSTYFGGNSDDIGLAITLDSTGNIYIAGATSSSNFPQSPDGSGFQSRFGGAGGEPANNFRHPQPYWDSGDAFVAKFDPTGSQLKFSTFLGGSNDDAAFSIAVDSSNNVYVGGCTVSSNFPVTPGALQSRYGGTEPQNFFKSFGDGFVTKLNSTGSGLVYSTYFGGGGDDCVSAIALDSANNVYMTGWTSTTNLPTTVGAFQRVYSGYFSLPFLLDTLYGDAFVGKLDPAGAKLLYLSYLGGTANDGGTAIAVDASGNAYVAGFADSTDFPLVNPIQRTMGGDRGGDQPFGDAFLSVVNPTGTALLYSSYLGGNSDDQAGGIALDSSGNVYLAGTTRSTNFPTAGTPFQAKFGGFDNRGGMIKGDAFYTVLTGFASGPVVTSVTNAFGNSPTIAPNTWVAIKGVNLSASNSRIWQDADFAASNGQMPTSLDGVSVTMNGKNAYIYYISGSQLNVLSPPDLASGPVQVRVTSAGTTSAAFASQAQAASLSFFVFDATHVVATHLDGSLIGPTSLYPGLSTPAKPGERIIVYANGYGPTSVAVVAGSVTQSGTLGTLPTLQIAGTAATVEFAGLISPGLYQFNIDVPAGAPDGDLAIQSQYGGQVTQTGAVIAVQH